MPGLSPDEGRISSIIVQKPGSGTTAGRFLVPYNDIVS